MRVSLGQIVVVVLLLFLLFGDFQNAKKKASSLLKEIDKFFQEKNRKKGT